MKHLHWLVLAVGLTACTRDDILQVQVPVPAEPAPGARVVVVYERGANGAWTPADIAPEPPPGPPPAPPAERDHGCAPYLLPTLPSTPQLPPKLSGGDEEIDKANYEYINRLRTHIEKVKKTLSDHHTKYLKGCTQ